MDSGEEVSPDNRSSGFFLKTKFSYWNRHGRSDSNIDERKVRKPDRMITGVQDPESRRKARRLKRQGADDDNGNDLVDLDDDDDSDSAPSSKRRSL
ncbi:hypothetical protein IMSHALPRED_007000 [Imshaugia aleurites]|uniref:Uncharacterized protein n=1 Tax=Imshaugia aleurites TaxID=172621 RepID=A0A8H3IPD8_9LECA|nr:hypothetical protein IMSHALPRED_007000 [Imshaugia aleurites]